MHFKIKSIIKPFLAFATLTLVAMACSQVLYVPTQADADKTGISTDSLSLGRSMYVDNCASCHALYKPERFTQKEWTHIMPIMQKKANCTNEQASVMMKYILVRARL